MKHFVFTLVLSGFSELSRTVEDALFEAGCDDATLGIVDGVPRLEFHRAGKSWPTAIRSAIENVHAASSTIRVREVRIDPNLPDVDAINAILTLTHTVNADFDRLWQLAFGTLEPPPARKSRKKSAVLAADQSSRAKKSTIAKPRKKRQAV